MAKKGARKAPSAKQKANWARFARMARARAASAGKPQRAARKTRTRVKRTMAKKAKGGGGRKKARSVALTAAVPLVKMGVEVAFGRPGIMHGAVQRGRSDGPGEGLKQAVDNLSMEVLAFNTGLAKDSTRGFAPRVVIENAALAAGGHFAHKGWEKAGLNRTLRRWKSPVVF